MENTIKIRNSVFETNSSSTHSIVVDQTSNEEKLARIEYDWNRKEGRTENTITFKTGEYDWDIDILKYPNSKLEYIFTYVMNLEDEKKKLYLDNIFNLLEKEGYKKENIIIKPFSGENDYGNIDHQSLGMLDKFLEDEEKLKNLIFHYGYYIIIDNDNR